ncbi:MAG TPA: recombination mediator RecR [Patescibacteria group bacterium]|nr:recombination mediator RecR [Patescibacteria group bacterium]
MRSLPEPIHNAAAAFDHLPGVGPRAALRYAYWLVTQPKEDIFRFAKSIEGLASQITTCPSCFMWSDQSPCAICRDSAREIQTLCVVATSQDVRMIEDTGVFKGRYHVLGGTLDPIEGRTPYTLTISQLLARLKNSPVQELILALDANIQGDTTALYLKKQLTGLPVRITRLARGLPTGASLEYADATTLADALMNRKDQ